MRDVAAAREAIVKGYAGRVFNTPATWASFLKELDAIPGRRHTRRSLCDAIADAITRLTKPSLFVMPATGKRCGRRQTRGGMTYTADNAGINVAAGDTRLYALFEQHRPHIAVLGIRKFAPPDDNGWQGFATAVQTTAGADAIVIDLRNSTGDDPRGALPLVYELAHSRELRPLRSVEVRTGSVAKRLRAARRKRYSAYRARDPQVWKQFVGKEPTGEANRADGIRQRGPDEAMVKVLLGGGCGPACELIARMLQTYAGAQLQGRVGWVGRLALDDVGVVVLPASKARLYVPTAAYVLNPRIRSAGGLAGGWHNMRFGSHATKPYDGLGRALPGLRQQLRWRADERRWLTRTPPPCASFAAVDDYDALPAPARKRLNARRLPRRSYRIQAVLHLPPEKAAAYVRGCPGLKVGYHRAINRDERSTSVSIRSATFRALTRLAQSPVVVQITVRHYYPPHPTANRNQ